MDVQVTRVRWWERVLLWFRPAYVTIDGGFAVITKTLFGRTVIVGIEALIEPL